MKKIVVIGNGKMAIECLDLMKVNQRSEVLLVIADPKDIALMFLRQYCKRQGLRLEISTNINSEDIVAEVKKINPDIILNINSFQIIRDELIAIPSDGIINFHNSPLPMYRGVNVCSWAIMNGEKKYGVTWHCVERSIDSGDIVAQKLFKLSETETASSLILKCIDEGVRLFGEFFPLLIEGKLARVRQDSRLASHYKKKDVPNDGLVDYNWSFERLDCFVRGLNFKPIPNSFVYPKSFLKTKVFYIQKVSRCDNGRPDVRTCGKIVGVSNEGVDVKVNGGVVRLLEVLNSDKKPIDIDSFVEEYNIKVGEMMGLYTQVEYNEHMEHYGYPEGYCYPQP